MRSVPPLPQRHSTAGRLCQSYSGTWTWSSRRVWWGPGDKKTYELRSRGLWVRIFGVCWHTCTVGCSRLLDGGKENSRGRRGRLEREREGMGRPPSLLFCSLQTPSCQTASVAYALCTTSYHRPHTDHTPTTYRLHTRPHTDHTPTTYRLHTRPRTDHTPTTYRLHTRPRTDCIPTTHRPRTDCIPTTHRPRTDCIPDHIPTRSTCSLLPISTLRRTLGSTRVQILACLLGNLHFNCCLKLFWTTVAKSSVNVQSSHGPVVGQVTDEIYLPDRKIY